MSGYLAIDPGDTSGYAIFDKEGKVVDTGQVSGLDGMHTFLFESLQELPDLVIIEEFVLYKKKALQQSGSKMVTSQIIGVIKSFCAVKSIKYVEQRSDVKPIAQMWSGVKPKGSHSQSHWVDAYNHGIYYLVRNKILPNPAIARMKNG